MAKEGPEKPYCSGRCEGRVREYSALFNSNKIVESGRSDNNNV